MDVENYLTCFGHPLGVRFVKKEIFVLRPPPLDRFLLQEILQKVGFALWQIQGLESTLSRYLVKVHKLEPGVAREEAEAAFEKTRKKTLGQLLVELRGQQDVPKDLAERLDNFVEHRNWLAHRSRSESRREVYQPQRRPLLYKRLDWIADEALSLSKDLCAALENHLHTHGITNEQIEANAAKIMRSWEEA